MECQICYEKIKKEGKCPFCDLESCLECLEKYVLEISEAKCPSCRVFWDDVTMEKIFPKTWVVSTYRKVQRKNLAAIEKQRIPLFMDVLVDQKVLTENKRKFVEAEETISVCINRFAIHTPFLKKYNGRCCFYLTIDENAVKFCPKLRQVITSYHEAKIDSKEAKSYIERIRKNPYGENYDGKIEEIQVYDKFLCPCPYNECRGLILSRNFTCRLCDRKICNHCREPKAIDHKCNEDTLSTVKLLREDTKPCPQCATPIHKISGCRQMWCPQCHIHYDYYTGKRDTGALHNPHGLEFLRKGAKQLNHNCQNINHGQVDNIYSMLHKSKLTPDLYLKMNSILTFVGSFNPIFRHVDNDVNIGLYLLGELTEKEFEDRVFRKYRDKLRTDMINNIHRTYSSIFAERINEVYTRLYALRQKKTPIQDSDVISFITEMDQIREIFNRDAEILNQLCTTDNRLDDKWHSKGKNFTGGQRIIRMPFF